MSITPDHPVLAIKRESLRCVRNGQRLCNGFHKKNCFKRANEHASDCEYLQEALAVPKWMRVENLEVGDFVVLGTIGETEDVGMFLRVGVGMGMQRYNCVRVWC